MSMRRIAVFCLFAACCCAHAATKSLVVEAGKTDRAFVPMYVPVPEGTTMAKLLDGAAEVPCQVTAGRLCWILDKLDAGQTKTYTVELGGTPSAAKGKVSLAMGSDAIGISIDGAPFTKYVFKPKTVGKIPVHRPYFYPVYGPGQTPMTRPFPLAPDDPKAMKSKTDHPHHTSLYVAHGDVNEVNNWHIGPKSGFQVHKSFKGMASGPVLAQFTEDLDWTATDKKTPVLAETRTVRVYRLPDTTRILDLVLVFTAKYGKVVFGDTKEGGLCATRMRPEFRADKGGRLVNAAGQTGGGAWGKKSPWVDCSGKVGGKTLGYAILDHPKNLRHPTTWHARTYGLLTANPFGLSHFMRGKKIRGDFTLEAGKSVTFRYRVYFHPGDEKDGKVASRFADYATPPKATWK